uniref:G-protein coupled receptors family 1 profile domain-containing protein n=1 Tax=Branchiostoma floridae TaxID=7739 RepID=C3ZGM1_BRAFL|eukprot:XP_002592236.1 hypothetical protein BRAFLDRAFT_70974 [Branchiostoma floridae]
MNGSTMNLTGGNSTVYDTFWPCLRGHLENRVEYDLAVAACSHLPTPFLDENRKVGIASAAVGTIALLLNGAVLSGVLKNRDLSKPVYLFVANLAAADCMAGVFSLFFCASFQLELLRPLTMLGLICAYFLVLVLSAVGVILLSMDRYVAILHPTYYQTRMSGRHVAVTLGIAWPACAVVCLSPVMGWNCIDMDTETCMANMPVVYVILIKSILLMAVVTVVFGNVRIFITLMRRFSRDGPPENPQENDCEVQARPYWGLPIALCNSVINPIIYALRIEKIRDAVQRRARRLANAVREKLGWTSNQVVNGHQTVGDAAARDGPGPSADNRTGQSAKWAVSRRLGETTRNTQNSNRLNVLFVASPSSVKVGETPSTEYIE